MEQQYGVLHEIGDMGLGFDVMNQQDQKTYDESINAKKEDSQQVVNEEKKD